MDKFFKDLSIGESRNLVLKCLGESDDETVEKFWFVELDKCTLSKKDSELYNRIFKLKNAKDNVSQSIYKNCLDGITIRHLIKKNWRRLFNNEILEKYQKYKSKNLIKVNEIERRTC